MPLPIDYEPRDATRRPRWSEWRKASISIGVAIGVLATPPAFILAMLSPGGKYSAERLLYPLPILTSHLIETLFVTPWTARILTLLAILQFPIYGAVIGYCGASSPKAF